jgi:hypothetical protein
MPGTGDDGRKAVQPSAGPVAADDPQLARLREVTGLEGEALDTLCGRLALLKQIKSGERTAPRKPTSETTFLNRWDAAVPWD